MTDFPIPVDKLTLKDLESFPVWEFTHGGSDDTTVEPCRAIPVEDTSGRLFATRVLLANGSRVWALLGNIEGSNPRLTELFLLLSAIRNERWFTLSRYFDVDRERNGPRQFAEFLGLSVDQVFPIRYDISSLASGDKSALEGFISEEPKERLAHDELITLAIP